MCVLALEARHNVRIFLFVIRRLVAETLFPRVG